MVKITDILYKDLRTFQHLAATAFHHADSVLCEVGSEAEKKKREHRPQSIVNVSILAFKPHRLQTSPLTIPDVDVYRLLE